jgi:hypothetical protein
LFPRLRGFFKAQSGLLESRLQVRDGLLFLLKYSGGLCDVLV